jgi:DNA-binding response OmpR family regulator
LKQRILVVEDEFVISLSIAQILQDEGFEVLGPAMSVSMALMLDEQVHCDAAVLDVNLHNGTAEPLAARLKARGTPFVVLTGSVHDQLPAAFGDAPLLSKPLQPTALIAALTALHASAPASLAAASPISSAP